MTEFGALLRLELLSKYADLRPSNWKKQEKAQRRKGIGRACLYLFLLLYLGGFMLFLELKAIDLLQKMGTPPVGMSDLLIIAAVAISTVGTLLLSFFSIMSTLYLSRDSVFLASLPIAPRTVLSAKLCQVWVSEIGINAMILLPACIVFGVKTGQDILFYLRMIAVWICSPLLPMCIAALLATVLLRVSFLLRHREAIMTVGGLLLMVLYFYASMSMGGLAGDTGSGGEMLVKLITSNAARIEGFTRIFPPAGWGIRGLLGDGGQLALFVFSGIAALLLLIFLLGFGYRKLSLLQAEAPTASGKKGIQKGAFARQGDALMALAQREIRQILRVPAYATNILPICLMPGLMTILMGVFIGRNLSDEGESLAMLMDSVPGVLVVAIIAGFLCFMADMNPALSTAVTREGRGHAWMLALPVDVRTHLLSKLLVGYGLGCLGMLITWIALLVMLPGFKTAVTLACVLCLLFTFLMSCLALTRDVKKPRLNWLTEQEAVKQNFGVLISMLLGMAVLALLAVLSWLLIAEMNLEMWAYSGIMAALLAAGCWAAYRHLMKTGEKYYAAESGR